MRKAFTIIELSLVLIIIAIVAGNLLTIFTEKSEANKIKETEIILDKIEQALANYLAQYGSIPCPGDALIAPSASSFGSATTFTDRRYCYGTDFASGPWYWGGAYPAYDLGIVPTQELQIPDELAFDAWGRRISFWMVENCNRSSIELDNEGITNTNYHADMNFSIPSTCGLANSAYSFKIKDAYGSVVANNAIYVLISHGKNGHGAYPRNGGSVRINAGTGATNSNLSADEITNAQMTANGVNSPSGGFFVQKRQNYSPGANYFDDIVRYKTKEQFIKASKGFIAKDSITGLEANSTNYCTLAKNAFGNPSNYCSSSSDANCVLYLQALANQINKLCF